MGAHLPGGPLGAHSPGTGSEQARGGRATVPVCIRQGRGSFRSPGSSRGETGLPATPITLPSPRGPCPLRPPRPGEAQVRSPGEGLRSACKKPCAFFPSDRPAGTLPRARASWSAGKPRPEAPQSGPLRAGLHPGRGPGAAHASPATEHRFPARAGLCLLTGSHPRWPAVGLPLLPQGL